MRELYIYYKVPAVREAEVGRAVAATVPSLLASEPGLAVRWRRRPPVEGETLNTWMEVWTHPSGIDVTLAARIESSAAAWQGMIEGPRHVEVFEPAGPDADGAS